MLLNLTTAPFTRLFKVGNDEPTTREPGYPTVFTNKIVIATYGLGAALEGDVLPPLCFQRPRRRENLETERAVC